MDTNFQSVSNGARFVRADMHIHSYGPLGSYDVTDVEMTPKNIVDKAIEKGLKIISITDHNEIGNSRVAIDYANGKDILVIPGIEVSTTQGHLLLYFESFRALQNCVGKLSINKDRTQCNQGIVECLDRAEEFGGIGVLAHIELTSGFEQTVNRFGPQMESIFKHRNLYGLEISSRNSVYRYTDKDDNPDRKNLNHLRIKELGLSNNYRLAKVMSSDAHLLSKLGTNADGDKKLTRVKVDELSFHGYRTALLSPKSRIRLENFIPESIPQIVGIEVEGGLLHKQSIRFNSNLNCIIGGRGTGKSTLLESVIIGTGNQSTSYVIDSEVWPDTTAILCRDETGLEFRLKREKNGTVWNDSDPQNGLEHFPIEYYGQGVTAEMIQHSDENPEILLSFLDKFVDIDDLKLRDQEICDQLRENQSALQQLRLDVKLIPDYEKRVINLKSKLEQLKKQKVGELVRFQNALIKERTFRQDLIKTLQQLVNSYKELLGDRDAIDSITQLEDGEVIVGKDQFASVKKILEEFRNVVDSTSKELNNNLSEKISALNIELKSWAAKEKEIQVKIDQKKNELNAAGIPFDLGRINQISTDLINSEKKFKELSQKAVDLKTKGKERMELLKSRAKVRSDIHLIRYSLANRINGNLKDTVEDFQMSIKYLAGQHSLHFAEWLKQTLGYRTTQVPKSLLLSRVMTPLEFAKKVRKGDLAELQKINDTNGNRLFSDEEISRIIGVIREEHRFEDIESIQFEDLPKITVTKNIKREDGSTATTTRSISKLSMGQQQSILLAILLHSDSKNPLLVDQPEDNLDNEFIYKTIVANLRNIKEKRQVIIVTHNPNIAVLGDAELVIPLKSTSTKSLVTNRGAIDNETTREITCEILEGGKMAFMRRKEIYGI